MKLDNYTVIIITASTASLFGLGVVLFSSLQRTFRGFVCLGASYLGLGLGTALVAVRGHIPDLISIPFANALLVAALFSMEEGMAQFARKRPGHRKTAIAATLGSFAIAYYFSAVEPNLQVRIVALSLFFALPVTLAGLTALQPIEKRFLSSQIFIAVVAWMAAAVSATRAVLTIFNDPGPTYLITNNVQTLSSLGYLLYLICSAFGIVWMSVQRYEAKLLEAAEHDSLTGLFNRRALEAHAARLLHQSRREGQPLTVVLFDVDDFKAINDTHGHRTGDLVLEELARKARCAVRAQDILARHGGEEFLLLLPDTALSQAMDLAERLRQALHAIRVPVDGGSVAVTASFGLAALGPGVPDWETLVSNADEALYKAKQTGKDRVAAHTD